MKRVLRIGISAALLSWVAWRTDWVQVGDAFGRLRLEWWLAALGLYLVTQLISGWRWRLLAQPLGFEQPWSRFASYYFIGMYFNLVLPTSVGGDVVRAWYLARTDAASPEPGRGPKAFLSVFLDRFSGLLVLLGLACVAALLCPVPLPEWVRLSVWGTAGCGLAALAVLPGLAWLLGSGGSWQHSSVGELGPALSLLVGRPGLVARTTLLSLLVQAANVVLVWFVGLALGAPIPVSYYWILVPMVTLLTLLPSINGTGVRETGTILFLTPLEIPESTAVSLAFLWFAVFVAASLCGGGVYLFGGYVSPRMGTEHERVRGDSDQGRTGQLEAAA